MCRLLGWAFIGVGFAIIVIELLFHWKSYSKLYSKNEEKRVKFIRNAKAMDSLVPDIIKKLPWVVVLGLLLIYLGMYIVGAPVPISIIIGNPAG